MTEHYFSHRRGPVGRRKRISARIWGHDLEFETAAGVFSKDGLDTATDILLRHSDKPAGAIRILDLGCGWGPIACALAVAAPQAEVWAVDVNERALTLTRDNAERLGRPVNVAFPEDVPEDLRFDQIWSNPPIRIGKSQLHALLMTWLPRLTPGGHARLVVSKNLGADSLQRWLIEQGWPTERMTSEKGFRILTVKRPDGP